MSTVERLSPHFTLAELTRSDTAVRLGIDNSPPTDVMANLYVLARGLESVRAALCDVPILISSGYRSPALNARIGGSRTSAHMRGLAADFTAPEFGTPEQVARHLATQARGLAFDQLILEGGRWIHIAFGPAGRQQVLTATFYAGGVSYAAGIHA